MPLKLTVNSATIGGYTLEEWEAAFWLVKQTLDILSSGDRPGRYFDVSELGDHVLTQNQRLGVDRMGGSWRGVKSMRTALPWLRDTRFTPDDLRRALRCYGKRFFTNRVLRSAAEYQRRNG